MFDHDWTRYFQEEENSNEAYGRPNSFETDTLSFAGSASALKDSVRSDDLEVILLFPGPTEGHFTLLHNLHVEEGGSRVAGLVGTQRFADVKEIPISSLVRTMSIGRRGKGEKVPSANDFATAGSWEDFRSLVGTGNDPIENLEDFPVCMRCHPRLAHAYLFGGSVQGAAVFQLFSTVTEEADESERLRLAEEHYYMLLLIWAQERGFIPYRFHLHNPPYETKEQVMTRAERKLRGLAYSAEKTGTADGDTEKGEGKEDPSVTGDPNEDDQSEKSDSRDRRRSRPRESHRPDRSISGHRKRSRSRSRSESRRSRSRGSSRARSRGRRRSYRSPSPRRRDRSRSRSRGRSRSPKRARRRSRSRSQSPARRTREGGDELVYLLRQLGEGVQSQNRRAEKDRLEKTTIGQYGRHARFLVDNLPARDFYDNNPRKSRELAQIMQSGNQEKQWQAIQGMVRGRPGTISKAGAIQFVKDGFSPGHNCRQKNRPGGLTVFMFHPSGAHVLSVSDRAREIKRFYSRKGEIDDEDARVLAKFDYYFPKSVDQGKRMLDNLIHFLELLTCRKGIASAGYRHGRYILERYLDKFETAQDSDPHFISKFLHYLDSCFYSFCDELERYEGEDEPLYRARRKLRDWMEDDIDETFKQFKRHGHRPSLLLPMMTEQDGAVDSDGERGPTKQPDETPEWWKVNPSPLPELKVKPGRSIGRLFASNNPEGKSNREKLPKVPHHQFRHSSRSLCLKYQDGQCTAKCRNSHIPGAKVSSDHKAKLIADFPELYGK